VAGSRWPVASNGIVFSVRYSVFRSARSRGDVIAKSRARESLVASRSARYTGGLWLGKFLRTVTYQRMTPAASREIGEVTERQRKIERMLAHGITARVRVERYAQSDGS